MLSIFFLIWVTLLVRIFFLSIQSNEYYEALANKNSIRNEAISPIRGEILDINGKPLAINRLGFKVLISAHLSNKRKRHILENEIDELVLRLPFLDKDELIKLYVRKDSYYNHEPIELVDFISYEKILPVYSVLNLRKYLQLSIAQKRFYPNGELASHLIGYISKANKKEVDLDSVTKLTGITGKSGIEKKYNKYLQGESGSRKLKVSAYNEKIEELSYKPPLENNNLTLWLDYRLQEYIENLFTDRAGAVIVMRTDGAILSAGSFPQYDINTFVSGISSKEWKSLIDNVNAPFTNKYINGLYPPGSTVKTGLGTIYLNSNQINKWTKTYCNGSMTLGKRNFRCWKDKGHGTTNLNKAIRESCDDYFYKGSLKVGIATMSEGLKRYGLGKKTGIDLPNEFIGTVPNREWKRQKFNRPWYMGETLNTSIGQGNLLTTPIQIARFTALMATDFLPTPHVVARIGEEEVDSEVKDVLDVKEKEYMPYIRKAMEEVCNHPRGTATAYLRSRVKIAGKTGTAQVVGISQKTKKRLKEHQMAYFKRSHAWFTTYGPVKSPQYVVTVLVEHGGHGGQAAGLIVSKIYNKLMQLGYID